MSRPDRRDVAFRRMLEADDIKNLDGGDHGWKVAQQAGADYWVLMHPELARLRRGDPARTPTVEEMRERASRLTAAMDGVPETWRLQPASREKAEYLARVDWFHELLAGLYEPVDDAIARLRRGDDSGVETLVRLLESDIYCHRSGYMKADSIRFLTRASLSEGAMRRLRGVVLDVVDGPDRREFRSYVRLARHVDSESLRAELATRVASGTRRTKRHAEWMFAGLG